MNEASLTFSSSSSSSSSIFCPTLYPIQPFSPEALGTPSGLILFIPTCEGVSPTTSAMNEPGSCQCEDLCTRPPSSSFTPPLSCLPCALWTRIGPIHAVSLLRPIPCGGSNGGVGASQPNSMALLWRCAPIGEEFRLRTEDTVGGRPRGFVLRGSWWWWGRGGFVEQV